MATTWNPADKSAGITLSAGNLVATNNNNAMAGVRAIAGLATGRSYWEVTFTTTTLGTDAAGIINGSFALNSVLQSVAANSPILGVQANGSMTGGTTGSSLGPIGSGTVCFAVDFGAQAFWARLGAAGNWNASGTANPATGAGGVSMVSINLGNGVMTYPWCVVGNTNDRMTANFGDSAFVGVPPAGFAAAGTQARTMILA